MLVDNIDLLYIFSIGQQQNVSGIDVNISAITVLFNKTLTVEVLLQLVSLIIGIIRLPFFTLS